MKDALSVVAQSRTRLAILLALLAVLIAGGVTLGSWTVGSNAGNGYAQATSGQNLVLGDASALTSAQLYPGGTGDVWVTLNNPNPFAVTITSVTSAGGAITSDKGSACDASTGVTFTNQTSLSKVVPANSPLSFKLTGAAHMDNTADQSCQGAIFTIPVTVSATS
jgi:hypothetical protein